MSQAARARGTPSDTEQAAPERTEAVQAAAAQGAEPVEELAEEAEAAVGATIDELKRRLAEKEAELEMINEQIKGLSPTDLAGERGAELKQKSETLSGEIRKLKERIAAPTE